MTESSNASKFREVAVDVATILAALSAVIVTGLFIRDKFSAPSRGSPPATVSVPDWRQYAAGGHRIGPPGAAVTIVEFGDYECPACAAFQKTLEAVLAAHPQDVALVYRHWPLPFHRFAYPAARAAECAAAQGRFPQFNQLMYAKQDSLGLVPFDDIAARSGVTDLASFRRCNRQTGKVAAIETDIAAAEKLGGSGTPTILLDSLRLQFPPDSLELEKLIQTQLQTR